MARDGDITVMGYNPDFAPFTWEENGRPCGFLIQRIRDLFASAGITLHFAPVPMAKLFPGLRSGDIDAIAVTAASTGRQGILGFSKPLAMSGGAWFALRDGASCAPENPSVTTRVITPATGPLRKLIMEQFPQVQLETSADYSSALRAVLLGDAHLAALNLEVGSVLCERDFPGRFQIPQVSFCQLPLAMAVSREDPKQLLNRLNPLIPERWTHETSPNSMQ
jgi:ABC-type amino acid transport substrate-binding protein